MAHVNSGADESFPYLHRYSPGVLAGLVRNRRLVCGLLQLTMPAHFFEGIALHDSAPSGQHEEHSLVASEVLKKPGGHAKQDDDPWFEAKVPAGQGTQKVPDGIVDPASDTQEQAQCFGLHGCIVLSLPYIYRAYIEVMNRREEAGDSMNPQTRSVLVD